MATDFYDTSYEIQAANAKRRRDLALAEQLFRAGELGRGTTQAVTDINRQYAQGLEPRVSGFGRRGLGRSGLFQRAMKEYATNQQRAVGDVFQRQQSELGQMDLARQQAEQDYQDALDRLKYEKEMRIIQDAQQLSQFAPFQGLFA